MAAFGGGEIMCYVCTCGVAETEVYIAQFSGFRSRTQRHKHTAKIFTAKRICVCLH